MGAVGLTLVVSAALTLLLIHAPPAWLRLLDHPNARSLHVTPVPRTGGLAVLGGLSVGLVGLVLSGLIPNDQFPLLLTLLAAVLLVGGVAFVDDWRGLPRRYRLLAHLVAALLLYHRGLVWDAWLPGTVLNLPTAVTLVLTVLFVVWMINLYNFMDGMDGLAASMAGFGFGALAVLGWQGGELWFGLFNAVIVAAALGFLVGNFPPARIFLGDVGASTFGLLAAAQSLWGVQLGLFPLWVAGLAFSPFIVDATWTLIARAVRGERVWEAHRSHHYQRLVLSGWSHRRTLVRAWLPMAGASACAIAAPQLAVIEQWWLIGAWVVIYGLIHLRIVHSTRTAHQ